LAKQGIHVITWSDENYPRRLKEIAQPPPVLYCRGTLLPQDEWAVAVVGTRRPSAYGKRAAEELCSVLAQNSITVISGLARGVDSIAHQTALANNGRTLAVFGCGIDRIYPPENRRLAERITQQGGLLSDYPGYTPDANNFPPRNRIISGLSMAVVVVEAGQTSGASLPLNLPPIKVEMYLPSQQYFFPKQQGH
jgi:DNA processing protein